MPAELLAVHLGSKSIILMSDPPAPRSEMSGALPDNAESMYWARCIADDSSEMATRDAEDVRKFIGGENSNLDDEQARNVAIIIGYLLRGYVAGGLGYVADGAGGLGHVAGGPFLSLERAAETFRLDTDLLSPKLVGGRLVFFAKISNPYDLLGVLHEYEYDLEAGSLRRVRCFQPDPVWETGET
ncbi:hypothetical protein ACNOYE_35530 [Nannocystaceae bacterium ST9]